MRTVPETEAFSKISTVNESQQPACDARLAACSGTILIYKRYLPDNLKEAKMGRGLLLWLLGIPIPIILIIWLFGGLHG